MKYVKTYESFLFEGSDYELSIKELGDNTYIVYAIKSGREVGRLDFIKSKFKPVLKATSVSVDPSHRRQGIASSMYVYAEKTLGMKFVRSDEVLTPMGKTLWNDPKRKFGLNERITFNTNTTGRKDWDDDLKKHSSDFTQILVNMKPSDFLKRVQYQRFEVDKDKVSKYVKEFSKGNKNVPSPTMWFSNKFQYDNGLAPSFHDGSHRMLALQELGIKEVPVKIIY